MKFWVKVESQEKSVLIEDVDGIYVVEIDGRRRAVDCRTAESNDYLSLIIDNRSYLVESAPVKADEGRYSVCVSGRRYELEIFDERLIVTRRAKEAAREDRPVIIKSPMPGLIVDVRVNPGDHVRAGSVLVVMEAMKMQNELVCDVDGIVKAVNVKPRDTVESQAPLIEIGRTE
jgi:biotin carboxyl carrier protein